MAKTVNKKYLNNVLWSLEQSMELSKEREKNMVYLQNCYNKSWCFDNENDICREYYILDENQDNSEILINLLNNYKPIRKELEKENHLGSYSSFEDSLSSKGILQFDLWDNDNDSEFININKDLNGLN